MSSAVRLASEPPEVTSPVKVPGVKAELLADRGDDRVFDGRGERAHFVDRHRLVGDAAHEIEQRGERHGRRHLVADVVRVVQVLAAGEAFAGEFAEAVGDVVAIGAAKPRAAELSGAPRRGPDRRAGSN